MGNLRQTKDDGLGTGVETINQYTYDNQGRVLAHTQMKTDNTELITTSSAYDANGNLCVSVDGNGNTTIKIYDELNQLEKESM